MRLGLLLSLVMVCTIACSNADYSHGRVQAIELDPRDPVAGEKARVYLELFDPYMYPGVDGAGPRVTLAVDGGVVEGRAWNGNGIGNGDWEATEGQTITVAPWLGTYWTLPGEPGTYKLTATFDGDTRTLRVDVD